MLELLRKMLHYRNGLSENESLSPSIVSGLEEEYDRILEMAEKEYTDEPPGDYYKEVVVTFLDKPDRKRKIESVDWDRFVIPSERGKNVDAYMREMREDDRL